MKMTINKGKKLLLVRYSDYLYNNCIADHIDVIRENGYCWFAKVGKQKPSQKYCNIVLKDEKPMIFLHSAKKAFICNVSDIIFEKPKDCVFPNYYNEVLFEKGNEPIAYFKITSCEEINKSILSNFIVSSSRNNLLNSLHSSMNSFFLVECKKDVLIKETNE